MTETDMNSRNMNYCFNVEYYKELEYIYHVNQEGYDREKRASKATLKERDVEI